MAALSEPGFKNCADLLGGAAAVTGTMGELSLLDRVNVSTYDGPEPPVGQGAPGVAGRPGFLTINVTGNFFGNGVFESYGYPTESQQFRLFALIHEMGHVMGVNIANHENADGTNSQGRLDTYTNAIKRDCGSLIGLY